MFFVIIIIDVLIRLIKIIRAIESLLASCYHCLHFKSLWRRQRAMIKKGDETTDTRTYGYIGYTEEGVEMNELNEKACVRTNGLVAWRGHRVE